MIICPNCSAELPDGAASVACSRCHAVFGVGSSWSPTSSQALVAAELSGELRILKFVVGGSWLAVSIALFAVAAKMGSNGGEIALIPGLLCLLVAAGVASARTKGGLAFGLVATAVLVLLGFGLLKLVGAAMYSR